MDEKFTIDAALQTGWNTFLANIGPLLLFVSLPMFAVPILLNAPEFILQMVGSLSNPVNQGLVTTGVIIGFVLWPVKMIAAVFIFMGSLRIALKAIDGVPFGFNDYIEGVSSFPNFLAGAFLNGAMMIMGFCLLFLPGFIVMALFYFYGFLIVDKGYGPLQALGGSLQLCKGAYKDLAILWLVLFFIGLIGFCAFLIGAIPAQLLILMMLAYVYRRLVAATPELSA